MLITQKAANSKAHNRCFLSTSTSKHSIPSLLPPTLPLPSSFRPLRSLLNLPRINRRLSRLQIHLRAPHKAGLLKDLPKYIQHHIERQINIRGREIPKTKLFGGGRESPEAVEDDDDAEEDQRGPGGVGLPAGFEGEGVAVETLRAAGVEESEVGPEEGDPG